jgi:hypothetical protein
LLFEQIRVADIFVNDKLYQVEFCKFFFQAFVRPGIPTTPAVGNN